MYRVMNRDNRCGFHMTFPNGNTLSVQLGFGNYCDNRDNDNHNHSCPNAEIACWDAEGNWYQLSKHDTVEGYVNTHTLVKVINILSAPGGQGTTEKQLQSLFNVD